MIRDYQEQLEFNPLQDGDQVSEHQITVCVRKRPLSKKEKGRKEVDVITAPNKDQVIGTFFVQFFSSKHVKAK